MTSGLVRSLNLRGSTFVDEDLVRLTTSIAHKRYLVELVLHHPLEVTTQEAIDEEDVEGTLMVGDEDIRLVGFQVFTTFDMDR